MSLNLFPARAAIGRATVNGQQVDVLMTPEFSRALSDLLDRIGGPDGASSTDISDKLDAVAEQAVETALLEAFDTVPVSVQQDEPNPLTQGYEARIAVLEAKIADLMDQLAMLNTNTDPALRLDDMATMLHMQDPPARIVKGIASGSRGANVALASLLAALAKSGLITDSTTV